MNTYRPLLSSLALFVFSVILLSGCQEPQSLSFKELQNVKLSNIGFEKATLTADVVLYNPNNIGLELSRTDFDVYINDALLGHSAQNIQVKVPNRQNFTLPLTMDVDIKNILKNGYAAMFNKEVKVRAVGSVKVGKMGVYKSFPVDYTTTQAVSFF